MVLLDKSWNQPGWKEYLSFYVFHHEQAEAKMIAIGDAPDPHRCMIFEDIHPASGGWSELFHFWVPQEEEECVHTCRLMALKADGGVVTRI